MTLDLVGGGSREGHVLTVDPETRDVVVVDEAAGAVSLVCGPSIAAMRFSAPERDAGWSAASPVAAVVARALGEGSGDKEEGDKDPGAALAALCARLEVLHLPFEVSEARDEVVVLQGALRVVAPFGSTECRSKSAGLLVGRR